MRHVWLALFCATSIAGSVVLGACGSPFSSCEAQRTCPPEADAGVGGAVDGGSSGDESGTGGSSGNIAAGGSARGGGATGGTATGGAAGSAGVSGSDGGAAGAGGDGSGDCEEDARACGIPGTRERRTCRDGTWVTDDECPEGTVCTAASATCASVPADCLDKAPNEAFCDENTRVVCSEDLTEATRQVCAEACDAGACVAATCGDGSVQGEEECDDGNEVAGDGCTNSCQWGPKELVLGGETSCAIFGNGWAKCWGNNSQGQLGLGDLTNRGDAPNEMQGKLPFLSLDGTTGVFSALSVARFHGCGISDGAVWCWGSGVLGIGAAAESPSPSPVRINVGGRAKAVTCGTGFTCALLESGEVRCWGSALTVGYPAQGAVGDEPGEMGTNLRPVDLGDSAIAVEAGEEHACALTQAGEVKCWGSSLFRATGWSGNDEGWPSTVDLGAGPPYQALALGNAFSCALGGGGLKCWGFNTYGQLGYDRVASVGTVEEGLTMLPPVPVTSSSDPIVSVHAMLGGACVVLRSNSVKCWGDAGSGSALGAPLGQPTLAAERGNIGDEPNEMSQLRAIDLGSGGPIRSFDSGYFHSCALFQSGELKCWGLNESGQLGVGHTSPIGARQAELGSALRPTLVR